MKLSRFRSILLPLVSTSKPNPHQISSCLASINFRRFLSSEISKPTEPKLDQYQNNDDADTPSNEDLKKQIKKLYNGDTDAFASVFEAILKRKLSGKTDKLDEDLVNELPNMASVDEEAEDDDQSEDSGSDDDELR